MNSETPASGMSTGEGLSRKQEAQLIAAAARVFRTGFPNPERSGCPSREALQALARKNLGDADSEMVFEHLTCCSPCFSEYENLLRKERLSKQLKMLALCASVLITVGVAVWYYVRPVQERPPQPEPTIVQQPPAPQPAPPIQYEVAVVDLRNRSPVRGEQQPGQAEPVVASLPTKPLDLSVYLPIGSEEGRYEMQILRDPDRPLVSLTESAIFENRNVVLRIRTDLTGLAPGRCLLGLRRANFRWSYYPVALVQ